MRIAMIGHKRVPGREGGIEVVVEELAVRLAAQGHQVDLYNRAAKDTPRIKGYKGCRILTIPTINRKSLDAVVYSFFASIRALFGHYDVIHYHALGPSVMLLIPHLFRIRTIVTVHGLNYKTPKWKGLGSWYIKQGEKIAARYADEITVLNRSEQRYFAETYHRDVHLIPNGVSLRPIRAADKIKKQFGLQKGEYILFLSRIVPGKGLEYLLDAYQQLKITTPKLVIAGTSVHVPEFYQMIQEKAKGNQNIVFTGFIEGALLDEVYSNARLFVFPSEAEGMPMCLLEAMSYNCPCLVSDIPENREVLGSLGSYFKAGDITSLLQALKREMEVAQPAGTRKIIKENFDWEKIAEKYYKVYRDKSDYNTQSLKKGNL